MKVSQDDLLDTRQFLQDYQIDLESEFSHLSTDIFLSFLRNSRPFRSLGRYKIYRPDSKSSKSTTTLPSRVETFGITIPIEYIGCFRLFRNIERRISLQKRNPRGGQWPTSYSISRISFSLRQSIMETLHSFGSSALNTVLSRSISFTWSNDEGNTVLLLTDLDHLFWIVIPPISSVNVTGQRGFLFYSFDLHYQPSNISIHFEIHPLNNNLS